MPGLVLAFFGTFALLVLRPGASRLPRFAYQLGELTYPLSLTHATLGFLVYELLRPSIGVALSLVAITMLALAVAWAIMVGVDRPARKPFANLLYRCATAMRIYKPDLTEPAR